MPERIEPARRGGTVAATVRWDSGIGWQFSRFAFVGGVSSALYAAVFLALARIDPQLANLVAGTASMLLANQLHRLVTFRAGERVSWLTSQVRGGGLSLAALGATSVSLTALDGLVGETTPLQQLLMLGAVSGAIGACRFVALRSLVFPSPTRRQDGAELPSIAATSHGPRGSAEQQAAQGVDHEALANVA